MRYFIAIEFKNDYFKELQEKIKDIKATYPKSYHLTLKFLGEIDDKEISKIKKLLNQIKFKSFNIVLSDIGFFPNEKFIRVVWVGLKGKIIELQKKIEDKLKFKDKRFHSHITLARIKFIDNKEEFIKNINNIKVKELEFKIDNFKLIKSTLTKTGPIYEDIETFKSQ